MDSIGDNKNGKLSVVGTFALVSGILIYIVYICRGQTRMHSFTRQWTFSDSEKKEASFDSGRKLRICTQAERLNNLRKSCERVWSDLDRDVKNPAPYTLVDTKHRLVMGWMSKGGCTAFKSLLLEAAGYNTSHFERGHSMMFVHNITLLANLGIHLLMKLNETETKHVLAKYFRFINLRHPFERLVSVYRGKVVSKTSDFPWFAAETLQMFNPDLFKNNETLSEMKRPQNILGVPTFSQFLTWIATSKRKNVHWNSIMESIHPCAIRWDAVLRLETMEHDGSIVLDKLKPAVAYDRISVKHSHQYNLVHDHDWMRLPEFHDVSDNVMAYFSDLYEIDLEMFGYRWDSETSTAACSLETSDGPCC